jgi:hypothetical protein
MFERARRYQAEQELFDHNEQAEAENADEGRGFWSGGRVVTFLREVALLGSLCAWGVFVAYIVMGAIGGAP